MASTFRLPGPESVGQVGVTRDPGVRGIDPRIASAETFGAEVGASARRTGAGIAEIGADLLAKRQSAEDTVARDTAQAEILPRYAHEYLEAQKQVPAGGAGFSTVLKQRLDNADKEIDAKLRGAGWAPSTRAQQAIQSQRTDLRTSYLVKGTAFEHNARTNEYETQTGKNAEAIIAGAMASGDHKTGLQKIDELFADKGPILGPAKAAELRDKYRENLVVAVHGGLKASGQHNRAKELITEQFGDVPSSSYDNRLIRRESGGNPTLVNQLGYAGKGQFGAPRLADLGFYKPGEGENLKTWSQTGRDAAGKWTGTFSIPGFPQVKTIRDFLGNEAAQDAVYASHKKNIDGQITERGLDRYIGQVIGGTPVTRDGIQAMAHLGGVAGAEKFLKSGGQYNPPDDNGTRLSDYARLGVGPAMPNASLALRLRQETEVAQYRDQERVERTLDRERRQIGEAALKEIYSRSENGALTSEVIEQARPYLSASEYKGALALLRPGDESIKDDPKAVVDLTRRIASDDPNSFTDLAASYVEQGKLKTSTFVSLTEKNRAASKDDQPASPYRASRSAIEKALEPGMLTTGSARIPFAASQQQALQEFDNWVANKPQGVLTREEAQAKEAEIIKRYAVIDTSAMKLSLGVSPYFGSKGAHEITTADVDAADKKLMKEIDSGVLTKAQQAQEIRRLNNWREVLSREEAARNLKVVPSGKR